MKPDHFVSAGEDEAQEVLEQKQALNTTRKSWTKKQQQNHRKNITKWRQATWQPWHSQVSVKRAAKKLDDTFFYFYGHTRTLLLKEIRKKCEKRIRNVFVELENKRL